MLGCNIHDKMLAYIHVVDTPHYGKTDAAGTVKLSGLAPGKYQLKTWHFNLATNAAIPSQTIQIKNDANTATIKLDLKPVVAAAQEEPRSIEFKY